MSYKIILVGCGKMGSAMLQSWIDSGSLKQCYVVDLSDEFVPSSDAIVYCSDPVDIPNDFDPDVIVMAVKPQIMDKVLPAYEVYTSQPSLPLFLSIAAGKNIASFEAALSPATPIVRAMPNTPAAIGAGMTVACANASVSDTQLQAVTNLLGSVGRVEIINDETLLDAVTAVSGSGPAYVFLLIEAMAKAGIEQGLPEELAQTLARQTVIGSAALAASENETPAATLRTNVTSPGGTTAAALEVLMNDQDGLYGLLERAIEAATDRSKELSE